MRDILFRGKRLGDGEWIEGQLFIDDKKEKHEILIGFVNYRISWEVDPGTVGQYTGLTDKDGKKIFEGDIVNCYTFTGMNDYRRGVVHWNEMFCGWYGKESCSLLCGLGEIYEVIGNIHDNPELLRGDGHD